MQRARTTFYIAACAIAAISFAGCGSGADAQPYSNDGVLSSSSFGGDLVDQVHSDSGLMSYLGLDSNNDLGSTYSSDPLLAGADPNVDASIPNDYGSVPGALSEAADPTLGTVDNVTNSNEFQSVAMDDPSAMTLGDLSSSDTLDGLGSSTDTSLDSALINAQDQFGDGASDPSTYDPSITDPSMSADPSMSDLAMDPAYVDPSTLDVGGMDPSYG
jgi:hypothetical protein